MANSHVQFPQEKRALAIRLLREGAVKFGARPLHLVGSADDASPIHLNLHTPRDPRPGPLSDRSIAMIGKLLHEAYTMEMPFTYVAGDPYAGDPIAAAFAHERRVPYRYRLRITKRLEGGRWVKELPLEFMGRPAGPTVLVDDVLTTAVNKLTTIRVLRSHGFSVPVVAVIIDREKGGAHALLQSGLDIKVVLSLFSLPDLLAFYRDEGWITPDVYDASVAHIVRKDQSNNPALET